MITSKPATRTSNGRQLSRLGRRRQISATNAVTKQTRPTGSQRWLSPKTGAKQSPPSTIPAKAATVRRVLAGEAGTEALGVMRLLVASAPGLIGVLPSTGSGLRGRFRLGLPGRRGWVLLLVRGRGRWR